MYLDLCYFPVVYSTRPALSSFFLSMPPQPPRSTLFPYTTLFRSLEQENHTYSIQWPSLFSRMYHLYGMEEASVQALRSEEHTSELQSRGHLVCRLLLEKKKKKILGKISNDNS